MSVAMSRSLCPLQVRSYAANEEPQQVQVRAAELAAQRQVVAHPRVQALGVGKAS